MYNKIEGLVDRLPEWLKNDLLANVIGDEIDELKVYNYYQNMMFYPRQPLQVWNRTLPPILKKNGLGSSLKSNTHIFEFENKGRLPSELSIKVPLIKNLHNISPYPLTLTVNNTERSYNPNVLDREISEVLNHSKFHHLASTLEVVPSPGDGQGNALKVTPTGTYDWSGAYTLPKNLLEILDISSGDEICFSAEIYIPASTGISAEHPGALTIGIREVVDGVEKFYKGKRASKINSWEKISCVMTVGDGTTNLETRLRFGTIDNTKSIYFRNLRIEINEDFEGEILFEENGQVLVNNIDKSHWNRGIALEAHEGHGLLRLSYDNFSENLLDRDTSQTLNANKFINVNSLAKIVNDPIGEEKVLKIINNGEHYDSYCAVNEDNGGIRLGAYPGGLYTLRCEILVPEEVGLDPDHENNGLRAIIYSQNEGGWIRGFSNKPSITGEWVELEAELFVPSNGTQFFIRLWNGFNDGESAVYYKNIVLEQRNLFEPNQTSGTDVIGNTSGFEGNLVEVTSSTEWASEGIRSLKATTEGLGGRARAFIPHHLIKKNTLYTYQFDFKGEEGVEYKVQIGHRSSPWTILADSPNAFVGTGEKETISGTVMFTETETISSMGTYANTLIPENDIFIQIRQFSDSGPSIFYMDKFMFLKPFSNEEINIELIFDEYSKTLSYARAITDELYPLKRLAIFDENNNKIAEKTFKEIDKVTSYLLQTQNVSTPKFYAELSYHGFKASVKKGFPQVDVFYPEEKEEETIELKAYGDSVYSFIINSKSVYDEEIEVEITSDCEMCWAAAPVRLECNNTYREYNDEGCGALHFKKDNIIILNDEEDVSSNGHGDPLIINPGKNKLVLKTGGMDCGGLMYITVRYRPHILPLESIMYYRNGTLDLIANTLGLFRRKYKDDISPQDLRKTYPRNYPYLIEQDYYLEKRILDEYNNIYPKYGLLKSEIYSYMHVIPKIREVTDNVLIWDEREWDDYVWAGDLYGPGVFELEIPFKEIPSNINILTMEEINQVIEKAKKFGTKVLPYYTAEIGFNLDLSLTNIESQALKEVGYTFGFNVDFDESDVHPMGLGSFGFNISNSMDIEQNVSFPSAFSFAVEAGHLSKLLQYNAATFTQNYLENVCTNTNEQMELCEQGQSGQFHPTGFFLTPTIQKESNDSWSNVNITKSTNETTNVVLQIYSDGVDKSFWGLAGTFALGTTSSPRIRQFFQPTKPFLSEVVFNVHQQNGTPGSVYLRVYNANDMSLVATRLMSRANFVSNTPFQLGINLNTAHRYVLELEPASINDSHNYTMRYVSGPNSGNTLYRHNGTSFYEVTYDVSFISSGGNLIGETGGNSFNLSGITENNLRVKGILDNLGPAKISKSTNALTGGSGSNFGSGGASWYAWVSGTTLAQAMQTPGDGNGATVQISNQYSNYLRSSNFGCSIPSDATIKGIEVFYRVKRGTDSLTGKVTHLRLNGNAGLIGSDKYDGDGPSITDTYVGRTVGGPTDLWGLSSISPTVINGSSFGVNIRVHSSTSGGGRYIFIDNLTCKIYWEEDGVAYNTSYTPTISRLEVI